MINVSGVIATLRVLSSQAETLPGSPYVRVILEGVDRELLGSLGAMSGARLSVDRVSEVTFDSSYGSAPRSVQARDVVEISVRCVVARFRSCSRALTDEELRGNE